MSDSADDASDPRRTRRRRLLRWGGGLLGGLVVLVLVAALVLPQLFTSEQLKGYVIPPLEEATGRQVQIEAIGLRVLPIPTIRVSGFRLANAEGFGTEPAVEARALNVDLALWPLFTGTVRPTAVGLEEPVIRYVVAEDGTTNFDTLGGEADTTEAEGPLLGGIPLSNVRVSDAQLHYTDRGADQVVRLDFGAQIGILPEESALTSNGTVDLNAVRAVLPSMGSDTLAVQDTQARYDVRVAPSAGTVDLRTFRLETAPLTLTAEGTLSGLNEQPTVDLTVETGATDLGEIAAFVPAAAVEGLNPRGTLNLKAKVSGRLSDTTEAASPLSIAGTGQLTGVGVDYEGATLLRDLNADLALSRDSVAVRSLKGQLLGNPLSGRLTVRNPMESPEVDGRMAGTAQLKLLTALMEDEAETESIQGTADYDLRFAGALDAIRPSGQIGLSKVQVPYESFRHPIEVPDATVQLTGTGLSMDRFTVRSGAQTVALQTTMQDLFPISKGLAESDPALSADFTLTSDRLNLVELYPEPDTSEASYPQLFAAHLSGTEVEGQSPEALAEKWYGGLELPEYAVEGRVEIGTLLNDPQRFDNLAFDVQMDDRRLRVRNLTASTYEGALAGSLTLDQRGSATSAAVPATDGSVWLASAGPGRAPSKTGAAAPQSTLTYDLELQKVEAGAVLRDWTTLGQLVTGTLTLNAEGNTALTDGLLPETTAFTAIGKSIVADGGLSLDTGPASALANALNLPTPSLKEFERLGGPFAIREGQFQLKTWSFGGSQFEGTVQGALGLGGSVDLEMTMNLPLSMLQGSGLASRLDGDDGALSGLLEKLVGGESGDETIPVTVQLGGTMRDPTVQILNRDAIASKLQSLAKEAGLQRLRNLFGGGDGGGQ